MTQYNLDRHSGGLGAVQLLNASTSTGDTGTAELPSPMSNWTLQVVAASTNAQVLMTGSLSTDDDDQVTTLLTFSSTDVSGSLISVTGKPATNVRVLLDAGASSGGASAWVAGTP